MKIWLAFLMVLFSVYSFAKTNKYLEQIDKNHPFYQYAYERVKGKDIIRKHFIVPYKALVEYYDYATQGMIYENKEKIVLRDIYEEPIEGLKKEDLVFSIDLVTMSAHPKGDVLSPDSVQELFKFNKDMYLEKYGAKTFLEAKRNEAHQTHFSNESFRFERDYIHLSDWRSLTHPPVKNFSEELSYYSKDFTEVDYDSIESQYFNSSYQRELDEITGNELTFGNHVELLENGNSYSKKVELVKNAKDHVLMAVMSFFCDKSSKILEDALIAKAKEGVDVKLMVEKVWTMIAMKKCLYRMSRGGVDIVLANDLLRRKDKSGLFHNKFMVIDFDTAIVGGMNIVESNNISTGFNHGNRDNDLLIRGPLATDVLRSYIDLWRKFQDSRVPLRRVSRKFKYTRKKKMPKEHRNAFHRPIDYYEMEYLNRKVAERMEGKRGQELYEDILLNPESRMDGVCRFVLQGPSHDKHRLSKTFIALSTVAEESMNFTTGSIMFDHPLVHNRDERARFTWNKVFFDSIFKNSDKGVKLKIIGNGIDGGYGELSNMIRRRIRKRGGKKIKRLQVGKLLARRLSRKADYKAAKKNYPYLEYIESLPNAEAYSNFQYMHAKLLYFDRIVSVVGSYNLEEWSADKSHEAAVVCQDKELSKQMDLSFVRDYVNSMPTKITTDKTELRNARVGKGH
jgi:phosphatidylserine/phosphatidylglycerophosphate/cardiolipin synthase-like enzyme